MTVSLGRSAYVRDEVSGGLEPSGPVLLMLFRSKHGGVPLLMDCG